MQIISYIQEVVYKADQVWALGWTYGLGSENKNIPGYVVLDGGLIPPGGLDNFKNGFLPASYQASIVRTGPQPIANINPQEKITDLQEQKLKFIKQLDEKQIDEMGL